MQKGIYCSTIEIMGVKYRLSPEAVRNIAPRTPCTFKREPENEHDPNAIMVLLGGETFAGYIPKALAAVLAPMMDSGLRFRGLTRQIDALKQRIYMALIWDKEESANDFRNETADAGSTQTC